MPFRSGPASWSSAARRGSSSGGAPPPVGRLGEDAVAREYERRGARVVGRNVRTPEGEIDLVVRDGAALVAVEVKTRTGAGAGWPAEAVTSRQLARVGRALERLAAGALRAAPRRIDVAEVLVAAGAVVEIRIHQDVTS
ncbi:MAG TPA: YraN family protein [Planctomycetota bacterium]|nr:YraN family protein [Planctomycetota bacterium]